MTLQLLAEPIQEPAWRDALQTLFVTLADELPVFYASAQVTSGHPWTGRSLDSDKDSDWPVNPVRWGQGWTGLPPIPTWWLWLGSPYAGYHSALPTERTTPTSRGVFYAAADNPTGPGDLLPLSTWLPEDLFSSLVYDRDIRFNPPLAPAKTIPAEIPALRNSPTNDSDRSNSTTNDMSERFPVPDDLSTDYEKVDCDEAKSLVEDRDGGISVAKEMLADPEISPATRKYAEQIAVRIALDRALIITANPACFSEALLKEAHKITDAREKSP